MNNQIPRLRFFVLDVVGWDRVGVRSSDGLEVRAEQDARREGRIPAAIFGPTAAYHS